MLRLISLLVTLGGMLLNLIRNPSVTMIIIWNAIRMFFTITAPILGQFFLGLVALWSLAVGIINGTFSMTASGALWLKGLKKAGFVAALDPILAVAWLWGHYSVAASSLAWSYDWLLEYFRREERAADPHMRPNVEQIVTLFGRGLIDVPTYETYMRDEGFDSGEANKLLDLFLNDPDVGTILDQHHRLQSKPTDTHALLIKKGFTQKAAESLLDNSYKILTIDQLLLAYLKGYIPNIADLYERAHALGYQSAEVDILVAANGEPISIGQALDLWNKKEGADLAISLGVANDIEKDWALGKGVDDVNRAVLEGPLNNYWFPAIKKLRYQMLGAPDYIRFAVRDVYNAAVRAANRLDEGFPEIVSAKLTMLGYSPQDAKDAWAAHWELPSPSQVFEMLHRGKLPAGITVDDYLASADYAPAWRQSLSDISYNPITRTDAKRMYKLRGDFDELVRHFKDNGYNDKDALDLAEFTRDDVNIEGNNERRGITSGLKNAVVSMYKNRMIDADEVRSILRSMTYTDETIEQFITEADFFRIQDEKADVASALKNAYVKALRSREDTVALLETAGWRGQPLDDLMGTWDLLRTSTELQPHQSTTRDLTKAELLSAFGDGLLDEQQLTDALLQLGYDESEATVLVQHSVLKKKKEDTALLVELTHQRYVGREITYDTASIELDKLQVAVTQKLVSLKKWQIEREKRIPDFTLAQLEGMIKSKVMEEDTARTFLKDQGYMDSQVAYLLAWWSGKRTPPTSDTKMTKLSRSDLESMYIGDKTKRKTVHDAFVSLGYTSDEADFILDGIDRNLKRS